MQNILIKIDVTKKLFIIGIEYVSITVSKKRTIIVRMWSSGFYFSLQTDFASQREFAI